MRLLTVKTKASPSEGTPISVLERQVLRCLLVSISLCICLVTPSAYSTSSDLSREQLAVILLLLKNSDFAEESSDGNTDSNKQALQHYTDKVANQVVASACISCHVEGGLAQSTRLIFVPGDDAANLNAIRNFIETIGDNGDLLLTKMSGGLQHGGGVQFSKESTEYVAMSDLIDLLYPPPNSLEYYQANVKTEVIEGICLGCHKSDGLASASQLVFQPGEDETNLEVLRAYIKLKDDEGQTILAKVSGVESHGGGTVLTEGTDEYAALSELLSILAREESRSSDVDGEGFFDGVTLANAEQTLRRAALIMAARLPTNEEVLLAKSNEDGLRQALLGLMQGEGFHKFLLRSANDQLHTDAFLHGLFPDISDLNGAAGNFYPIGAEKYFLPQPYTDAEYEAREKFMDGFRVGITRAPLELIAHIVKNDRPYTEIMTSDYTMVNWYSEQVFQSEVEVGSDGDPYTFAPGKNYGQVLKDENYESEFIQDSGTRVLSHSGFIDYPHSGILNDLAWLNRYPTTETNRNRARARWTYYHFLGVDIETSAPRTTDPEALADTDNPTLNNPACTICHNQLDPVAGAYQNYGNEGFFRDSWGGLDSLPDTYKYPHHFDSEEVSLYQDGDTWFRDMLPPGFNGTDQPSNRADDSLRWLGQQIAMDSRFSNAVVNFWWPALMGAKVLASPEVTSDPDYQQRSNAFNAQRNQISALAERFESKGFLLRELLADMAMSPWFRAKAAAAALINERSIELASVGVDRLLTPEELDGKNKAVLGYTWGINPREGLGEFNSTLTDRLRLYYGGIDSVGVKERARSMTALMANVAERQALHLACGVTTLDFYENQTPAQRRLFNGVSMHTTPRTEIAVTSDVDISSFADRTIYKASTDLPNGIRVLKINFNNDNYNHDTQEDRNLNIDKVDVFLDDNLLETIEAENFENIQGFDQTTYENGDVMGGVLSEEVDGAWGPVGWGLWGEGYVSIHIELPESGRYRFEITAWGTESGDGIKPSMTIEIAATDNTTQTRGSLAIKAQIQSLFAKMLGSEFSTDDPEIEDVYQLLLETWEERQTHEGNNMAWFWWEEECIMPREIMEEEWNTLGNDPKQMIYAWSSVMYFFLTHFDYLHE